MFSRAVFVSERTWHKILIAQNVRRNEVYNDSRIYESTC